MRTTFALVSLSVLVAMAGCAGNETASPFKPEDHAIAVALDAHRPQPALSQLVRSRKLRTLAPR